MGDASVGCERTVTVGGRCYLATDVHYMMWGKINRLCNEEFSFIKRHSAYGADFMVAAIAAWKFAPRNGDERIGIGNDFEIAADAFERFAAASYFAMLAYDGHSFPRPPHFSERRDCSTSGVKKSVMSRFHWRWAPVRDDINSLLSKIVDGQRP
jgi:hypothetical protein